MTTTEYLKARYGRHAQAIVNIPVTRQELQLMYRLVEQHMRTKRVGDHLSQAEADLWSKVTMKLTKEMTSAQ